MMANEDTGTFDFWIADRIPPDVIPPSPTGDTGDFEAWMWDRGYWLWDTGREAPPLGMSLKSSYRLVPHIRAKLVG